MSSARSSRGNKRGRKDFVSTLQTPATPITSTKVTKSSGSRAPDFRQRIIDNRIYPAGYQYPDGRVPPKPEAWAEMQQMLAKRRASLSPSVYPEEEYDRFVQADNQVIVEEDARETVIPKIQGATQHTSHIGRSTPFGNIANMLLREAKAWEEQKKGPINGRTIRPDYYYGAHPDQLDLEIRNELSQYIVPSTDGTRPMLPNFFIEAEGPKGSFLEVVNQACIDGAIGVRAMHKLETYGQETSSYDNKTRAISSIYKDGTLRMYAHHLSQPNGPGTKPEYYMSQLNVWILTGNRETLLKGTTAFRNAKDWMEAQRNAAINHANTVWRARQLDGDQVGRDEGEENEEDDEEDDETVDPILTSFSSQSPFSAGQSTSRKGKAVRQDSDTSADELALAS